MDDPVYAKLKADAAIVLADLWRALSRQPIEQFCRDPRVGSTVDYGVPAKPAEQTRDLCYFHLN